MDNYDKLTKEAKYLLVKLFKTYKQRIKSGQSRDQSIRFTFNGIEKEIKIRHRLSNNDIESLARELEEQGFIKIQSGSNTIWKIYLNITAIAKMKRRFVDYLKMLFAYLGKLIRLFIKT